jgi:hypothetical protein
MRVVDVVEPSVGNTVVTVNAAESTANKVEIFFRVVRDAEIVVLHEGDVDQPGICPEIRNTIVADDGGEAVVLDCDTEHSNEGDQTNIGNDDAPLVGFLEDGRRGFEVVATTTIILRSDVEGEISGPAEEEHAEELSEGDDGRSFDSFLQRLREATRNEDGVLSKVVGEFVVSTVSDAPRVIRNEKSGVEDETDKLVDGLGGREGLVTSFVSENPQCGEVEALEEPENVPNSGVDEETSEASHPCGSAVVEERNEVGAHDEMEDSNLNKITAHVIKRASSVLFEVFLRNSIADSGESEILRRNRETLDVGLIRHFFFF